MRIMKDTTVETTGEQYDIDPQDAQHGEETAERPAADAAPPAPKDKPAEDDSPKEMRRALKEMRQALKETNETARFWMEQARTGGARPKKDEEPEPEPKVSVDLVEAVTNGDAKAITKAMRELGFVSRAELESHVNARVESTRAQVSQEQQLYDRYPDLADDKSEFFKATAQIYNDLARKDPQLAKSGTLAEIAAELADKRLAKTEGRDTSRSSTRSRRAPAEPEYDVDDDDLDPDEEEERVERVGRQSGERGRRTSSGRDRDDTTLDATQKTIVAKLKAAGADISEDGYRKRAQKGVRLAGMPTRRPRF
jgi:hypothetical protein